MQALKIIQVVVLMALLAMAASCTVAKQYSDKVFAPTPKIKGDSSTAAVRFLELDNAVINKETYVKENPFVRNDSTTLLANKTIENITDSSDSKKTVSVDREKNNGTVSKTNPQEGIRTKRTRNDH